MIAFDNIYSQFLSTITSCTLAQCSDEEIQEQLYNLVVRAIGAFRYPRVQLAYTRIDDVDYFINEITQNEINVLLPYMRIEWLRSQLAKESNFERYYYDNNAKTHSQGNLIQQLNKAIENEKASAEFTQRAYYRVNQYGRPAIGDIQW